MFNIPFLQQKENIWLNHRIESRTKKGTEPSVLPTRNQEPNRTGENALFLETTKMSEIAKPKCAGRSFCRLFWFYTPRFHISRRNNAHLITRVSRRNVVMDCRSSYLQTGKRTNSKMMIKRNEIERGGMEIFAACKKKRWGFLVDETCPRTNYTRFPAKKSVAVKRDQSRKLRNLTKRKKSWSGTNMALLSIQ